MNNPVRFIDPDGRYVSSNSSYNAVGSQMDNVDDIIEVDKAGDVVSVIKADGDNIFKDCETGEVLNLHDPSEADNAMLTRKFEVGEQLYLGIYIEELAQLVQSAGTKAKELWESGNYIESLRETKKESFSKADFPLVLSNKYGLETSATSDRRGNGFVEIKGLMIRFEGNNTLYNGSDAGQFVWGNWMKANGYSLFFSRFGAHMNEIDNAFDSSGDQKAIKNGYNFK